MRNAAQLPGGYRYDGESLYRSGSDRPISNFYLTPAAVYTLYGEPLPSACDIEVICGDRRISLAQRSRLADLTPAFWKTPRSGCVCYPGVHGAADHLQVLFQLLVGELEPVEVFQPTALGWTVLPSGEAVYATGSGVIGAEGYLPSDQFWIPARMKEYQLERETSPIGAVSYFWSLFRTAPGITDILLANALSAILFPCFKSAGVESRFPIVLEGPSESKKTTIACLTSCLYNRRSAPRSCIATLTSTQNALELRGANLRHATLVIDDLFPDGGKTLEQRALDVIRSIANQRPREVRSGKSLTGSELECGMVITAEHFPDCGISTRTRCLRLVLNWPIPNSALVPLQEHPALLGDVFATFIARVAGQFADITTQIMEDFRIYRMQRSQPNASPVQSERLEEIGFVLYTSLKIFLSTLPEGGQREDDLNQFLDRLHSWIVWQLSPEASPRCNSVAALLSAAITQYPAKFIFKKTFACIQPQRLCSLLQGYDPSRTIKVPDMIAALRKENLLDITASGEATRTIPGHGRCLHIDRRRLGI